jgi:outer membrane protein TolC
MSRLLTRPRVRAPVLVALSLALAGPLGAAPTRAGAQPLDTAQPPDAPLSFDAALRRAESRSADLAARRAAEQAARERAVPAGQRPDPVLQAGVNNLPVNGPDAFSLTRDFMTMRYVGVMQEWTRPGTLAARSAKAGRDVAIAATQLQFARTAVQRETALAWLERHFQDRVVALVSRQVVEARLQVDAADLAVRGGRGTTTDAIAARAAVAQAEDRLAEARRDAATAAIRLARWTGSEAASAGAPPDLDAVTWAHGASHEDVSDHPELVLAGDLERQAQADLDLTRAEQRPDPSVQLMYSQRGPGYSNMVSVGITMPWPWDAARRQDRRVAAQAAELEQRRDERIEAMRVHAAEVRGMSAERASARERIRRYDETLLPLATDRVAAALSSYRAGSGPLASVLDARRALLDTQRERIALELDAARLWARLEFMVPRDLDATATAPAGTPSALAVTAPTAPAGVRP